MKYYIANLAIHFILIAFLLVLVIITSNRNNRKKTAHATVYFFPIILSALLLFCIVKYTGPRLLDITDVVNENYYSYTGTLDEIGQFNNYLVVDGERYYINPLRVLPEPGSEIRIRYTKYSRYAIDVADVATINVNDSINEDIASAAGNN